MQHSSDNTTDTINLALFVNENNEYEQGQLLGFQPYGNTTLTQAVTTELLQQETWTCKKHVMCAVLHMHLPGSTNAQDQDIRAKNSATRNIRIRDFFFISKEISIGPIPVHRTRLTNATKSIYNAVTQNTKAFDYVVF